MKKIKLLIISLLMGIIFSIALTSAGVAYAAVNSGASNSGNLKTGYNWSDDWVGEEASFLMKSDKRVLGLNTVNSRIDIKSGVTSLNSKDMWAEIVLYDGNTVTGTYRDTQTISNSNRAASETRTISKKKVVHTCGVRAPGSNPTYIATMTGTLS